MISEYDVVPLWVTVTEGTTHVACTGPPTDMAAATVAPFIADTHPAADAVAVVQEIVPFEMVSGGAALTTGFFAMPCASASSGATRNSTDRSRRILTFRALGGNYMCRTMPSSAK
jgi:hypothetical protein